MRSNLSRYYIRHCNNNGKKLIILESQQTPHISPSRASYGVSVVKIWEKIDRVVTVQNCIGYPWSSCHGFHINHGHCLGHVPSMLPYYITQPCHYHLMSLDRFIHWLIKRTPLQHYPSRWPDSFKIRKPEFLIFTPLSLMSRVAFSLPLRLFSYLSSDCLCKIPKPAHCCDVVLSKISTLHPSGDHKKL